MPPEGIYFQENCFQTVLLLFISELHALEFPEGFSDDDEICHAARGTIWELENVSAASVDRNYSSSTGTVQNYVHTCTANI